MGGGWTADRSFQSGGNRALNEITGRSAVGASDHGGATARQSSVCFPGRLCRRTLGTPPREALASTGGTILARPCRAGGSARAAAGARGRAGFHGLHRGRSSRHHTDEARPQRAQPVLVAAFQMRKARGASLLLGPGIAAGWSGAAKLFFCDYLFWRRPVRRRLRPPRPRAPPARFPRHNQRRPGNVPTSAQ